MEEFSTETTFIADDRRSPYSSYISSRIQRPRSDRAATEAVPRLPQSVSILLIGLMCTELSSFESWSAHTAAQHTARAADFLPRTHSRSHYWSQAYYWTESWQRGERETLAELEAGEALIFHDPREAINWLSTD